jgi:hypothetical protein
MTESIAREILGSWIEEDGGLYCLGRYVSWHPDRDTITLDDTFSLDELEAITWWVTHKKLVASP